MPKFMSKSPRSVFLLSNTMVNKDPRAIRNLSTFRELGWDTISVGLKSHDDNNIIISKNDNIELIVPKDQPTKNHFIPRILHYIDLILGVRFFRKNVINTYFKQYPHFLSFLHISQSYLRESTTPIIWIANDWEMLPIAFFLQQEFGGRIIYDAHEFASDQFNHDLQWKMFLRPLTLAIEKKFILKVDEIIAVSPGICEALQNKYNLPRKPVCIRNIPLYQKTQFRPTQLNNPISFLYQGVIARGRGLEALIVSTQFWKQNCKLTIRGPGQAKYLAELEKIISNTPTQIDIKIEPPVNFENLVEAAASADIGIMLLDNKSLHNKYALPNKIFEYMMAGLALIISDTPDMSKIIIENNAGTTVSKLNAQRIANTVNNLTISEINQMKRASLAVVQKLNWESEKTKLSKMIHTLI